MTDAQQLLALMPFASTLGVELDGATPQEVSGRLAWSEEVCTTAGIMHGGALMTLADSVGAICAFLNLPAGATTATVESKTNFFRPVRQGHVRATSRPLHVGRTTIVVQTELFDEAGRRVAHTLQTQQVLPG
jgi:uncharacterized protein (TIGR00369 family)